MGKRYIKGFDPYKEDINNKMENKYYTPEIEEFYVGFKYERGNKATEGNSTKWYKEKITSAQEIVDIFCCEEIRVKYLDKEDIESLGFTLIQEGNTFSKLAKIYFLKK